MMHTSLNELSLGRLCFSTVGQTDAAESGYLIPRAYAAGTMSADFGGVGWRCEAFCRLTCRIAEFNNGTPCGF